MAKVLEHDFDEDIKINKFKLPDECMSHASTYYYWAKKLAEAKTNLDAAEDGAKLFASEMEMQIRKEWDDSTQGKMTEASVKALLENKMEKEKAKIRNVQKEVYILEAGVKAMEHRKSELDNLTTLLVKGFYAAPNGGKREGLVETSEREIRSNLNKKKKDE